jgi:hypothetical protein
MAVLEIVDKHAFGPQVIADRLLPITKEETTDEKAFEILSKEYPNFLSSINDSAYFDNIKKSPKFLRILFKVCAYYSLSLDQKIYCNSMIYKLMSDSNEEIKSILLMLGELINRTHVERLKRCGIDRILATYLAVAKKSSFEPRYNIPRLNFCINCMDPDFMTTQRITDIYCASFDTLLDIKDLFNYSVKDSYIRVASESWIDDKVLQVSTNMNMALLSILESLNEDQIYAILFSYYKSAMAEHLSSTDVRFSMRDINRKIFKKVAKVIDKLKSENMYLP